MESKNQAEETKPNLWIFGDSYSYKWELPSRYKDSGQHQYAKYFFNKHNKLPIHFSDILNEQFSFNKINNFAKRGSDNYTILETIGEHINDIKENDYVSINWSDVCRYRVISKFKSKLMWWILYPDTKKEEYNTINPNHIEQVIHRDSSLTYKELHNWQNILLKSLPYNTIFWTPFMVENAPFITIGELEGTYIETIVDATNKKIIDSHYSENGFTEIGKWLIDKFKENVFRNKKLI